MPKHKYKGKGKRKRQRYDSKKSLKGLRYEGKLTRVWNRYLKALNKNPDLEFNEDFIKKHYNLPPATINKIMIDYNEEVSKQAS